MLALRPAYHTHFALSQLCATSRRVQPMAQTTLGYSRLCDWDGSSVLSITLDDGNLNLPGGCPHERGLAP